MLACMYLLSSYAALASLVNPRPYTDMLADIKNVITDISPIMNLVIIKSLYYFDYEKTAIKMTYFRYGNFANTRIVNIAINIL